MVYVLGCVLVREGNKNRHKFTGTKYVRSKLASYRETREIVLSTPAGKKNVGSTPRELQCSDRAQTSTTGFGRPSCVDVLINNPLAKSARTKRYDPKQTKTYQIYVFIYTSLRVAVPCFLARLGATPHGRRTNLIGCCH